MSVRILDSIVLVCGKSDGRFPSFHSFIIEDGRGGAVLFDTGCGAEAPGEGTMRFRVKTVINSLTHPDHSAGNGLFDHTARVPMLKEVIETGGGVCALSEEANREFLKEFSDQDEGALRSFLVRIRDQG
jgi:glyoxylase-like metal-dependent hydrolase (beta-lactamase superfamily II)